MGSNCSSEHLRAVIETLQGLSDELNAMMDILGDKKRLATAEKQELQERLRVLKASLKEFAKTGTVDRKRRQQSDVEEYFFEPAVSSAIANCNVAYNSNPIKSNWYSCLYGMRLDIDYLLHPLKEKLPK